MMWAQAQSTIEGFGHAQRWEVTPKSGRQLAKHAAPLPSYIVGTAFMCLCAIGLFVASLLTGHAVATLFYILTIVGSGWVIMWFMVERFSSKPSFSVSLLEVK
jgi:protein-S-isoprenylcysteine O-methyltransferase Ste14